MVRRVWMGVGHPCLPIHNDNVTPRHLFCLGYVLVTSWLRIVVLDVIFNAFDIFVIIRLWISLSSWLCIDNLIYVFLVVIVTALDVFVITKWWISL